MISKIHSGLKKNRMNLSNAFLKDRSTFKVKYYYHYFSHSDDKPNTEVNKMKYSLKTQNFAITNP